MHAACSRRGDSSGSVTRIQHEQRFPKKPNQHTLLCSTDDYEYSKLRTSPSASTCNSDDSGIDRTFNLTPSSPIPYSDLEDGNSLDAFQPTTYPQYELGSPHSFMKGRALNQNAHRQHTVVDLESPNRHHKSRSVLVQRTAYQKPAQSDNRFHILSYEQILRLNNILSEALPIYSRNARFPTIWVQLSQLFMAVKQNLENLNIPVRDIRLNGGAAAYIVGDEETPNYNDIDVLVSVDLSSNSSTIQRVKAAVLDALMSFLPEGYHLGASSPDDGFSSGGFRSKHSSLSQSTNESLSPTDVLIETCSKSFWQMNGKSVKTGNGNSINNETIKITDQDVDHGENILSNHCQSSTNGNNGSQSIDQKLDQRLSPNTSPYSNIKFENAQSSGRGLPNSLNFRSRYSPSIPSSFNSQSPSTDMCLRESYIYKQFRKYSTHETDCWSLISLGVPSVNSKVVEFKFVDRMRRQFEFTVDSFQILLDSGLSFFQKYSADTLNKNFYPTVVAESVAGAFCTALHHLQNKLIQTTEPEMIRGGGLLKYCRLLVNGYQAPDGVDVCTLERYMSSRFFIDFQDLESQRSKIEAFIANHFPENDKLQKIVFLKTVYRVVSGSTICLMTFERYQTLNLITQLIERLRRSVTSPAPSVNIDAVLAQQNLTVERIFLGYQMFPVSTISFQSSKQYSLESGIHPVLVEQSSTAMVA